PASCFFFLMFLVPESPRFLVKVGKDEASLKILSRIGGEDYGENEAKSIKASLNKDPKRKVKFKEIANPKVLPILIIGIVLAVFQQWCGINIIFNYAQEIFEAAGYNVNDMLFNIVIAGSVNLIFTLIAMKVVD